MPYFSKNSDRMIGKRAIHMVSGGGGAGILKTGLPYSSMQKAESRYWRVVKSIIGMFCFKPGVLKVPTIPCLIT